MKKIILDTNFLLIPFIFKVDIFKEISNTIDSKYNLFIIDKTIKELNSIITRQKGKNKDAARFALQLIKKNDIKIIRTEENGNIVDKEIIDLARSEEIVVATQDKELKEQLRLLGVQLIVLRQKTHLELL